MSCWDGQRWIDKRSLEPKPRSRTRRAAVHSSQALLEAGLIAVLLGGLVVGTAFAAKGGGGCTRNVPGVTIDNNYSWGAWGSWGMPGQRLLYAVKVINYDMGCRSSTFTIDVGAPDGFTVSVPTNTITLKSYTSAYLWAYVRSPEGAGDGTYAVTASVVRAGTTSPTSSFTSAYKVYSTDETAPKLFWQNPNEGTAVSGRSYSVSVSSKDDHAVQRVELAIDGVTLKTQECDNISYICDLHYTWSTKAGDHTATYRAWDWMGNKSSLTVNFTAG